MKTAPIILAFGFVILPARAQRGDKPGEPQPKPSAHWVVPSAPALSPEEEVKTFRLVPGFRAELVAADPLIRDPVTMAFGPDGRIWVVEMTGYMRDLEGSGSMDPTGCIAVLDDTDGDGRMDRRQVFIDKLVLPRAIALVDGGVLFGEPPQLWYSRDNDGDGMADTKVRVSDDYGGPGNVEHLPNGLMWALDNWIYNARHNARYRYEGDGRFSHELTIARGQWGISQDDTGRIYHNSNSDPLRCDLLPAEYLKRNPAFPANGTNVRLVPGSLRVWPGRITTGIDRGYRSLDVSGRMFAVTAACGPVVYRGSLFPREFLGDAFVAEPAGNLVKRIRVREEAGRLIGSNAYQETEFMTSTDERFPPVNLFPGPVGALWLVDMYRGLIQDKQFLTTYLRRQVEERGLDRPIGLGRIWRIVPKSASPARLDRFLAAAAPVELVRYLGDANGWTRDTAQRLLVEKRHASRSPAVADALRRFVIASDNPLGRLHALWTLHGCGLLQRETVLAAMMDTDARVVAAAIRLSDSLAPQSGANSELTTRMVSLVATRKEPSVRLQLALSLANLRTQAANDALVRLVSEAGDQPFLADATVSGLAGREPAFIEALAAHPSAAHRGSETVRLATSATMRSLESAAIERTLSLLTSGRTPPWTRAAVLDGVELFLPKSLDGEILSGVLPVEPKPLVALAAQANAGENDKATMLLARIKWPGKAGAKETPVRPLDSQEQALFEHGKLHFSLLCAACHQPSGQGLPGLAPSLLQSRWVLGDARMLARIVLDGKTRENLVMPAWKAAMDDDTIAGVMTFLRRAWGHHADPVSSAAVARARQESAKREEPWTDAELRQLERSPKSAAN